MIVFSVEDLVVNCDDDSPQAIRLTNAGAEVIPIEIFGDYAAAANKDNTKKVDGVWVFAYEPPVPTPLELAVEELRSNGVTSDSIKVATILGVLRKDEELVNEIILKVDAVAVKYGLTYLSIAEALC